MISKDAIGCLFKRKSQVSPKLQDLKQSLYLSLIEAKIMLFSIESVLVDNFTVFDGDVGDRKCQTRASMLIDILNDQNIKCKLVQEKEQVLLFMSRLQKELEYLGSLDHFQVMDISKYLKKSLVESYFKNKGLIFIPSEDLRLLSLSYFTTMKVNEILKLADNQVSLRKIKIVLNHGIKAALCKESIAYEKKIAQLYCSQDVQLMLEQNESKGFCEMTSFFISFKAIFQKIKKERQLICFKILSLCTCYGVRNKYLKFFKYQKNKFVEYPIKKDVKENVLVFEGYQYQGSYSDIQCTFNIPKYTTRLSNSVCFLCTCKSREDDFTIKSIEESLLAIFAQHPQFTQDVDINFKDFGLDGSLLQKEYEFFKTLKGFSMDDMSNFFLTHVYASTIDENLKESNSLDSQKLKSSMYVKPATGLATSLKNA